MRQWRRRLSCMEGAELKMVEELFYIPVKTTSPVLVDYVELYDYELEAFKLVHYDGLTTDEAAVKMGLSKTTFWRILEQARVKIAKALVERKPLKITPSRREGFHQQG